MSNRPFLLERGGGAMRFINLFAESIILHANKSRTPPFLYISRETVSNESRGNLHVAISVQPPTKRTTMPEANTYVHTTQDPDTVRPPVQDTR